MPRRTDHVSTDTRSAIMRAVKSRDVRSTEKALRAALVGTGLRGWRMYSKDLPGVPDFVFVKRKLAIFVDGCFWHGCSRCYRRPKSRRNYWDAKVRGNIARHRANRAKLRRLSAMTGICECRNEFSGIESGTPHTCGQEVNKPFDLVRREKTHDGDSFRAREVESRLLHCARNCHRSLDISSSNLLELGIELFHIVDRNRTAVVLAFPNPQKRVLLGIRQPDLNGDIDNDVCASVPRMVRALTVKTTLLRTQSEAIIL